MDAGAKAPTRAQKKQLLLGLMLNALSQLDDMTYQDWLLLLAHPKAARATCDLLSHVQQEVNKTQVIADFLKIFKARSKAYADVRAAVCCYVCSCMCA